MHEVRWERMFPDQLEEAFQKCPLVYFTHGLCEPHGPHNAVGLDALKAHGIACEAARAGGGIVAPPDYWHIHELGGYAIWGAETVGEVDRKWMTAVPPWIHLKNICYQIRAADALGFHAIILLTGHYGPNWRDTNTVIDLIRPHIGAQIYSLPDKEANVPGFDGDGKSGGDHAGRVETSLLWSLEPACVDTSRIPEEGTPGHHFAMYKDAYESNRAVGDRMVKDEVNWLCNKGQELLDAYDCENPATRMESFAQVENFWKEKVVPILGDLESMEPFWGKQKGKVIPDNSVWKANSGIPEI